MSRWSCRSVLATVALAVLATGPAASTAGAELPDGRAFELVSPPDKNDSDISQGAGSIRAAAAGDGVAYNTTGAFDTPGTGAQGEVNYIARRGVSAWSTTTISVPQVPNPAAAAIGSSYPFLSEDLARGILYAFDPVLTPEAQPGIKHLYLRNADGSYAQLDPNESGTPIDPATVGFPTYARFADATPDLGHVIFEYTLPLTPDSPSGAGNKLYEWDHGTLRLVSIKPDGSVFPAATAGPGAFGNNNTEHTISDDGSRIFFQATQLYMRQDATSTVMINASENTTVIVNPVGAVFRGATPDGSKAIFTSSQRLADEDLNANSADLYMYDATRPSTDPHNLTLLSPDNDPSDGGNPNVLGVVGMSDDGSYVYFAATGKLVSGQPDTNATAVGLYLWHDGVVRYVATLANPSPTGDALNWNLFALAPQQRQSRVTADGKTLLFTTTAAQPGGYDNAGKRMFYLYDATSGETRCVTCNPDRGIPATSDAAIVPPKPVAAPTLYRYFSRALSVDGRRVFFHTGDALVPEDVNEKFDVYEYDALTGKVALISTGHDESDSFFGDASSNGDDVYFLTLERLTGWDNDDHLDLYDAKVGGGLPEPPVLHRCIDDECQGLPSSISGANVLGSTTFSGVGNLAEIRHRTNEKVKLLRRATRGSAVLLILKVPAKGRLSARGAGLRSVARAVGKAGTYTLTVRLTRRAKSALARKHRLKVRVRVGYIPAKGKASSTIVAATVNA